VKVINSKQSRSVILAAATWLCLANGLSAVEHPGSALIENYCFDCHDSDSQKGEVDLEAALGAKPLVKNMDLWRTVISRVENGDMPFFSRAQRGERTQKAQADWIRFLWETEQRYWQTMRCYLQDDLGVKSPIVGTIIGCSTPNLMAELDVVDTHAYWHHPVFPGRPWDPANWFVTNTSMVNSEGGVLTGLARKRVYGKPLICTEYNHPAPNTYSSEAPLLLASFAAFQDWLILRKTIVVLIWNHGIWSV